MKLYDWLLLDFLLALVLGLEHKLAALLVELFVQLHSQVVLGQWNKPYVHLEQPEQHVP